jgi:hypothetical protein
VSFKVIGIDGIERDSAEIFGKREGCVTDHGLNSAVGFSVRRTFVGHDAFTDRAHEIVCDGESYGDARACAVAIQRDGDRNTYAVVDWIYSCGCRGQG